VPLEPDLAAWHTTDLNAAQPEGLAQQQRINQQLSEHSPDKTIPAAYRGYSDQVFQAAQSQVADIGSTSTDQLRTDCDALEKAQTAMSTYTVDLNNYWNPNSPVASWGNDADTYAQNCKAYWDGDYPVWKENAEGVQNSLEFTVLRALSTSNIATNAFQSNGYYACPAVDAGSATAPDDPDVAQPTVTCGQATKGLSWNASLADLLDIQVNCDAVSLTASDGPVGVFGSATSASPVRCAVRRSPGVAVWSS
jgi:hypothetical protein